MLIFFSISFHLLKFLCENLNSSFIAFVDVASTTRFFFISFLRFECIKDIFVRFFFAVAMLVRWYSQIDLSFQKSIYFRSFNLNQINYLIYSLFICNYKIYSLFVYNYTICSRFFNNYTIYSRFVHDYAMNSRFN